MTNEITIIANAQISHKSMGGSDKIFIELSKVWKSQGALLRIFGCREARTMCRSAGLEKEFKQVSGFDTERLGLFLSYALRTLSSLRRRLPIGGGILYSSSDFFPDLIFAFWQKILNRNLIWVAGMYLVAPSPFQSSDARSLRGITYWLTQRLGVMLMRWKADNICVLCQEDMAYLVKFGISTDKVIVISGGIDFDILSAVPEQKKQYHGCFLGRFHHQKGLPELIRIWRRVVDIIPDAKLVIAGWGRRSWVDRINALVAECNLQENVSMPGFVDNQRKFALLKASKVFLFPSSYESWGIVVAEALASGTPVVAFDIPAMRKFSLGVSLVPCDHLDGFAEKIVELLQDDLYYEEISSAAIGAARGFRWQDSADAISHRVERGDD